MLLRGRWRRRRPWTFPRHHLVAARSGCLEVAGHWLVVSMNSEAVPVEEGCLCAGDLEVLVAEVYNSLRRFDSDVVVILASTSLLAACWAMYRWFYELSRCVRKETKKYRCIRTFPSRLPPLPVECA
jgi:hypothetical protein